MKKEVNEMIESSKILYVVVLYELGPNCNTN